MARAQNQLFLFRSKSGAAGQLCSWTQEGKKKFHILFSREMIFDTYDYINQHSVSAIIISGDDKGWLIRSDPLGSIVHLSKIIISHVDICILWATFSSNIS